jgi:hypothetical protein
MTQESPWIWQEINGKMQAVPIKKDASQELPTHCDLGSEVISPSRVGDLASGPHAQKRIVDYAVLETRKAK